MFAHPRWMVGLALILASGCGPKVNLFAAVNRGDLASVERLLDRRPQRANARDPLLHYTPLHYAADRGEPRMIALLLSRGADPRATKDNGETALHLAARNGSSAAAKLLLDRGALIDAETREGKTPLVYALEGHGGAAAELLIQRGAKIPEDREKRAALLNQAVIAGMEKMVAIFLARGFEIRAAAGAETPLHLAARFGHVTVVGQLLARGAPIDSRNHRGYTPLHEAASGSIRFLSIARFGAPPQKTPIWVSSQVTVAYLLRQGADLYATTREGMTALHLAAEHAHYESAQVLLAAGAEVNARLGDGTTPLHLAVRGVEISLDEVGQHVCSPRLARLLVEYGADPQAQNKGGTALQQMNEHCRRTGMAKLMAEARPGPGAMRAVLDQQCAAKDFRSCLKLGDYYLLSKSAAKNPARASLYYSKACDGGQPEGCNRLGVNCAMGRGVPKDEERAAKLYRTACEGRHAWACFNLGKALEAGRGLPRDLAQAALYYQQACESTVPRGCHFLGRLYQRGEGVPKNRKKATELFQRACQRGEKKACEEH